MNQASMILVGLHFAICNPPGIRPQLATESSATCPDALIAEVVGDALAWEGFVRAAESTSFAYLAGEPDLYTLQDGEAV